jgi:hypothetical protein
MTNTKKYCLLLGVLMVVLAQALVVNAEMTTVTGKLTGLSCLIQGFVCPIDKADPMIALERDFVLVTASGDYYFLSNIGLGLKGKYALQTVEVTGDLNPKYKAIKATSLKVGGKEVWNLKAQQEMEQQLKIVTP